VTPQVWWSPALNVSNVPLGGLDCPCSSLPQHSTVPDVVTPQVWSPPALTLSNVPLGGILRPWPLWPQHSTVPDALTPQVCHPPTLTVTQQISIGSVLKLSLPYVA